MPYVCIPVFVCTMNLSSYFCTFNWLIDWRVCLRTSTMHSSLYVVGLKRVARRPQAALVDNVWLATTSNRKPTDAN